MAFALLIYWPSFFGTAQSYRRSLTNCQNDTDVVFFFLSFCLISVTGTINNKVGGPPNRPPVCERFPLPAESSPTPSPTPAAAFLSDIAEAGAGAPWPETPMHGWSRGQLRLLLDTLDRSSGNRDNRVLHNCLTNSLEQTSKNNPAPKTQISEQN